MSNLNPISIPSPRWPSPRAAGLPRPGGEAWSRPASACWPCRWNRRRTAGPYRKGPGDPDGLRRPTTGPIVSGGREEAVWPTALVLFTQCDLGTAQEEMRRTAAACSASGPTRPIEEKDAEIHDIDLEHRRLAVGGRQLLLGRADRLGLPGPAPRRHRRRTSGSGRASGCSSTAPSTTGGVNYGNRAILGKPLDPIPGPTALMLLALQGPGHEPRVAAAVRTWPHAGRLGNDLEHLCWAGSPWTLYPAIARRRRSTAELR